MNPTVIEASSVLRDEVNRDEEQHINMPTKAEGPMAASENATHVQPVVKKKLQQATEVVTFSYRLSGVQSLRKHYKELAELIGEETEDSLTEQESDYKGAASSGDDDDENFSDEPRTPKRKSKAQGSPGKSVQSPPVKPGSMKRKRSEDVVTPTRKRTTKTSYQELTKAFGISPTKKTLGRGRPSKKVKHSP